MITISSEAGQRLAKSKAALDCLNKTGVYDMPDSGRAFSEAMNEFCIASNELADELIAAGMHQMDGNP